jgi:hypothetical protein
MAPIKSLALFWLFLTVLVVITVTGRRDDPSFRLSGREMDQLSLRPLPSPPEANLSALATLNREAAAQVAQVGLTPTGARLGAARRAASWMSQAIADLPSADGYTTRQWEILEDWRRALHDYANGRSSALARVRFLSGANVALYEEIVAYLSTERGEIASVSTSLYVMNANLGRRNETR